MADELRITTVPDLRSPVLVAAFRGWNDGAHGATLAVEYLSRMWHAERFADIPHTRPVPVTGSASDPDPVQRLGLAASRYEGPTGIVGVLHDAFRQADIPSASLWAAVPHYVSLTPSPRAAEALCSRLGELLGVELELRELREAGQEYVEHVTEAVVSDAETQAYVEALEQQVDELEEEASLPSGDSIAAELTRFLREHDARKGGSDD